MFEQLELPKFLNASIQKLGFTEPTPIQAQTIPLAFEGSDILGSAKTGSGKTLAYAIPALAHVHDNKNSCALILTPTRELAMQVEAAILQLCGTNNQIKTALVVGGADMLRQIQKLERQPQIIIGTPGRIIDHLMRGTMSLQRTGFLVLDETDRMLDLGFGIQLDKIATYLPNDRQTLMFSATLPKDIMKVATRYLSDPKRVSIENNEVPVEIEQETIKTKEEDKFVELTTILEQIQDTVIIFVKTKHATEKLAKKLKSEGYKADAIHGNLRQNQRDRVLRQFRNLEFQILVATDIAARGLDVKHIKLVINYDLPQRAEDYIHRIGRTGRAGAIGKAINLLSNTDQAKWRAIEKLLYPDTANNNNKSTWPADDKYTSKKRGGKKTKSDAYFSKEGRNDRHSDKRSSFGKKSGGKPRTFVPQDEAWFATDADSASSQPRRNDKSSRPWENKEPRQRRERDNDRFNSEDRPRSRPDYDKSRSHGKSSRPWENKEPRQRRERDNDWFSNDRPRSNPDYANSRSEGKSSKPWENKEPRQRRERDNDRFNSEDRPRSRSDYSQPKKFGKSSKPWEKKDAKPHDNNGDGLKGGRENRERSGSDFSKPKNNSSKPWDKKDSRRDGKPAFSGDRKSRSGDASSSAPYRSKSKGKSYQGKSTGFGGLRKRNKPDAA